MLLIDQQQQEDQKNIIMELSRRHERLQEEHKFELRNKEGYEAEAQNIKLKLHSVSQNYEAAHVQREEQVRKIIEDAIRLTPFSFD